jgi:hypothetical protein
VPPASERRPRRRDGASATSRACGCLVLLSTDRRRCPVRDPLARGIVSSEQPELHADVIAVAWGHAHLPYRRHRHPRSPRAGRAMRRRKIWGSASSRPHGKGTGDALLLGARYAGGPRGRPRGHRCRDGLSQRHRAGRIGRCGACAAAHWCVFFLECLAVAPGNQEVGSMVGSISVRTRAPAPRVGRAWPSRGERTP